MSKVTSKLQVTLPKALADRFAIRPGDEIEWIDAGDTIRVVPGRTQEPVGTAERLALFDAATARQALRQEGRPPRSTTTQRGWRREDLHDRGRAR